MEDYDGAVDAVVNYFNSADLRQTQEISNINQGFPIILKKESGDRTVIETMNKTNINYSVMDKSGNVDQITLRRDGNHDLPVDPKTTIGKDLVSVILEAAK